MAEFPRETMVRIVDLEDRFDPRIVPLFMLPLTPADKEYLFDKWSAGEHADIGGCRYERVL